MSKFIYQYIQKLISFQKLDYKPCDKFVMLMQYLMVISLSFQPFLRGGPIGSSLGSYKGSSGHTGSLSSPKHYPQQFGTPLRSQGLGNKLDRTPTRLGNMLRTTEFLSPGFFLLCRGTCTDICNRNPLCNIRASTKSIELSFI